MRVVALGTALTLFAASMAFAQTPPPATPAQKPAAPAQPAAAPPPPPAPFPEGAKIAFVVLQRVANESADGKAATGKIQALQKQKAGEIDAKNKQLAGIQEKLQKEVSVLSTTAQADLSKQAEKLNTEIQRLTQDAQQELTELQEQLRQQFEARVQPVLEEVRKEKGLHFIFNGPDSGLVAADPGLDISLDVIKKLDAKPGAPAKPPGR
jgi:Skp family chaperone for outer membrane proteins